MNITAPSNNDVLNGGSSVKRDKREARVAGKEKPCTKARGRVSYLDELNQGHDETQYTGTMRQSLALH
jgi:hypothetical protein